MAHTAVRIDVTGAPELLQASLRQLMVAALGDWCCGRDSASGGTSSLGTGDAAYLGVGDGLQFAVISGGITNALFKVSRADGAAVICRVFGAKTEVLIDRKKDNATFQRLSDLGFGPTLLGTFENGRLEEFLPSRPLLPAEMGSRSPVDFVALIARETARMHALPMEGSTAPLLWPLIQHMVRLAEEAKFSGDNLDPKEAGLAAQLEGMRLSDLRSEIEWLMAVLPSALNGEGQLLLDRMAERLRASSPSPHPPAAASCASRLGARVGTLRVPSAGDALGQAALDAAALMLRTVYAHNDLLAGNVLLLDDDGGSEGGARAHPRIQLVDYEYGGYNYCGYDPANHFCEYAGFDGDFDRWFPSQEAQLPWLQSYAQAVREQGGPAAAGDFVPADAAAAAVFWRECTRWVNRFALASHAFWGVWSIVQARHSPIDFDFMSYGVLRVAAFRKLRGQLLDDFAVGRDAVA